MVADLGKVAKASGAVAFIIVATFVTAIPLETPANCDYDALPILCAEFPVDGVDLHATLNDEANDAATWRSNILLDFLFILSYVALLGALAMMRQRESTQGVLALLAAAALLGQGIDLRRSTS